MTALKTKPEVTALNLSGIDPLEYKVLVLPKKDDGTIKLKSGLTIYKPDDVTERDQNAATEGVLIAASPVAFRYEDGAPVPQVGQTVIFAKYAGNSIEGADGQTYRLMNDKDVIGVRA